MFIRKLVLLIAGVLIIGCASTSTYRRYVPNKVDKLWVVRQLTDMKYSHIRNRGAYNSPEFDDYCVEIYIRIIEWIEENHDN